MSRGIEKKWCIYKSMSYNPLGKSMSYNPLGIGEIMEEWNTQIRFKCFETDRALETWNKGCFERFETIKEAVEKFVKDTQDYEMERLIKIKFPSAFKKDSV